MRRLLQHADGLLNAYPTRVVLSVCIMASLIPTELGVGWRHFFFGLFSVEMVLRIASLVHHRGREQGPWGALLLLALDIVAVASFWPVHPDAVELLRWGRAARLALLLAYWGPLARDFLLVALQRERLSQILLIGGLAALVTGAGATTLRVLGTHSIDLDGDGVIDPGPPEFPRLLWWAFRQVQDPGHLVSASDDLGLMAVSLALTAAGLLLVAFLIGVGSSLVADLVEAGRARAVGLRQHVVVLNLHEANRGIIHQIRRYFSKQVLFHRVAVQGEWAERPAFMQSLPHRAFIYRAGPSGDEATLRRLDTSFALNVAILSPGPDDADDARAVAAAMSVREMAKNAWVVVELNRPANIAAALRAGRGRTVPVPARRLASLVLANELTTPGCATLVQELVALRGQEIYTCLFGEGSVRHVEGRLPLGGATFLELQRWAYAEHGCLLLGHFEDEAPDAPAWRRGTAPYLNPARDPTSVRGLIGLASQYRQLRGVAEALARGKYTPASPRVPCSLVLSARPRPRLRRVIVLGFAADTVEMVAELLRHFPALEVTLVGANEDGRHRMRDAFLAERMETGARFEVVTPKQVRLLQRDGTPCGLVNIRVTDRYAEGLFRPGDDSGRVGNVFDYDAMIALCDTSNADDPDAATVLCVLKILDHTRVAPGRLRHVVAEIFDPEKAALLHGRLGQADSEIAFAFVKTHELREQILSHAFFVPGLPAILHEMLTHGEQEIVSFTPTSVQGRFDFGELVEALAQRTPRIIPLALVTAQGVEVSPSPERSFAWAEIHAVFCLATATG